MKIKAIVLTAICLSLLFSGCVSTYKSPYSADYKSAKERKQGKFLERLIDDTITDIGERGNGTKDLHPIQKDWPKEIPKN